MAPSLIVSLFLTAALPPDGSAHAAWRYVLPAPGDPFEHPPLRALGLGREKPEDVVEKVSYRGNRRRYGQIRYGSPSSVRVTVVLDEGAPGEADLYVDADRNRRLEAKDRVSPGEGRTWRVPLDVAIVEGEVTRVERRAMAFRLGSTGLTFSSAAPGYLEGAVRLGGRDHAARRTDADSDGRLTGPQDRLWIDLDDDGRWDPVDEQFLFAPILTIGSERCAARSDEFGARLALEPLEGTGTVRLTKAKLAGSVAEVSAMLIGRGGSAVGLNGGAEATVPVDEYRLGTVTLVLEDPAGGLRWSYVFSDNGRRGEPVWYKVAKGEAVSIDPIGAVELATGLDSPGPKRPGEDLDLQPRLYTGDGLLIVTCYRGTPTTPGGGDGPGAGVALIGGGRTLATARSGFA